MIKLVDILKEVIGSRPKAIFLSGPAGAGKSTIVRQMPISGFETINVDDTYEELLKTAGVGLKITQSDTESDEEYAQRLATAAKMMGQAQKITKEKYKVSVENLHNIIIDGTGAASLPLLKKKQELEGLGYDTLMLMIYVSPITSLTRNVKRGDEGGRSLTPSIVLRTWEGVNKNIDAYKQAFGDNFIIVNNNPEDAETDYDEKEIKSRFFTNTYKGKVKTPKEMAKTRRDRDELNRNIKSFLQNPPEFTTIEDAKSKIQAFIQ